MEGLLVGGSAGAAVAATLSWLTAAPGRDVEGQNVVIILPDGYVRLHSQHCLFYSDHNCFTLGRVRNYMSKPWFSEGLLGREMGADLAPEVTAQINKVISENDKHTQEVNGTVPTQEKAEAAVSALADTMKGVGVSVKGLNGIGKAAAS
jgi:hypothetical protein